MKTKLIWITLLILPVLVSSTSTYHPLTKGYADTLYCPIEDCNGDNDFHVYINQSMCRNVTINYTVSDSDTINVPIKAGDKFVFGCELT